MCSLGELVAIARWYASHFCIVLKSGSLLCMHGVSALTFVLAPLPNALFSHCGSDELSGGYEGSGPLDLGRFITSMFVVTGFALPVVLAHSEVIRPGACVMSIIGGGYTHLRLSCYEAADFDVSDWSMGRYWLTRRHSSRKTPNLTETKYPRRRMNKCGL